MSDIAPASPAVPAMAACSVTTLAVHPGGAYSVLEVHAPAGAGVVPHRHEREDLTLLLVEGAATVTSGDRSAALVPGVPLGLPRGRPHAVAAGEDGARLLVVCAPAGLESVLQAVADPGVDADDRAALLAGHGVHAVGGRW
ncbi:MAG: cupin domain-containing protein [Miltoncostaeaceae bacterium]